MNAQPSLLGYRLRYVLYILLGLFFLVLGVQVLILAYAQTDPFNFIMTFFASNFMILFSLALIAGFVIRIYRSFIPPRPFADPEELPERSASNPPSISRRY